MHIPHGDRHRGVTGELLDGAGRHAGHRSVGGERVTQDMKLSGYGEPGFSLRPLHPHADELWRELLAIVRIEHALTSKMAASLERFK